MTPDEYVGWLSDMRDAQQAIEKAGAVAGLNRANAQPPSRSGRRAKAVPRSDNSFSTYGVVNRAAIAAEMERATADEIQKRFSA